MVKKLFIKKKKSTKIFFSWREIHKIDKQYQKINFLRNKMKKRAIRIKFRKNKTQMFVSKISKYQITIYSAMIKNLLICKHVFLVKRKIYRFEYNKIMFVKKHFKKNLNVGVISRLFRKRTGSDDLGKFLRIY